MNQNLRQITLGGSMSMIGGKELLSREVKHQHRSYSGWLNRDSTDASIGLTVSDASRDVNRNNHGFDVSHVDAYDEGDGYSGVDGLGASCYGVGARAHVANLHANHSSHVHVGQSQYRTRCYYYDGCARHDRYSRRLPRLWCLLLRQGLRSQLSLFFSLQYLLL